MKFQLFLGFLLAVSMVLGANLEGDYLAVVGIDAPTSDVVTAANFAASVSSVAIFSGASTEDISSLTQEELEEKYLVIIEGDSVTLMGSDTNQEVFENYFLNQGFDVTIVENPEPEDVAVTKPQTQSSDPQTFVPEVEEEVVAEPQQEVIVDELQEQVVKIMANEPEEFVCEGCLLNDVCLELGETVDIDGTMHTCTEEGLIPEEPSIFVKIWNWFAKLF